MLRQLGLLFAALALFSIAGGHWAMLQTVAWAGMLRDYTQRTGSVAVAIQQTFDGEHPCELCQQIATAKQQETRAQDDGQQPDASKSKPSPTKADKGEKALLCLHDSPLTRLVSVRLLWIEQSLFGSSREEQPPTPPPRRLPRA